MNISVIIPHYPLNSELDALLKKCVGSLVGHTELIVVVNEGTGFGKAVNTGVKLASGKYIAIINNDIYLEGGSIQELAKPGKVISATWGYAQGPAIGQNFHPAFFCIQKELYEKMGGFSEEFTVGDYEDDDFYEKCRLKGIEFEHNKDVRFYGKQGFTKDKIPKFYDTSDKNHKIFIKKWKKEPDPHIETHYEGPIEK